MKQLTLKQLSGKNKLQNLEEMIKKYNYSRFLILETKYEI